MTRSARFNVVGLQDKKFTSWTLLDELMSEVPGKDNYIANITDSSLGFTVLDPQGKNKSILNVGFYHRRYKIAKADAMGLVYSIRGFSDPNIFMAETTQPRISPITLKECKKRKCVENSKRMSYAIPLEIIYLTPLSNWNPYNLTHFPLQGNDAVTDRGKRSGGFTNEKAFNGTNDRLFYRTPAEFFNGREVGTSLADTVKGSVGVLGPDENVRKVTASGIRIFLPNISGIGVLRTRYPIVPVHGESSGVWKELNALKDIVKSLASNEKYLLQKLPRTSEINKMPSKILEAKSSSMNTSSSTNTTVPSDVKEQITDQTEGQGPLITLTLSTTTKMPPGEHSHMIELSKDENDLLKSGQVIDALTSEDNGHSHQVTINYYDHHYQMMSCDDASMPCWDGHTSCLLLDSENVCPQEMATTSNKSRSKNVYPSVTSCKTTEISDRDVQIPLLSSLLVKSSIQSMNSITQSGSLMPAHLSWSRNLTRLNFGRLSQPNLSDPEVCEETMKACDNCSHQGRSPGILARQFQEFFNNP